MFSLVFTRRYSMAHRLMADARSKCAVPHGHNELVTVRLQASAARRLDGVANMVEPFEIAKTHWHRWIDEEVDHALQLSDRDPLIGYFREHEPDRLARLLVTPGDPTTEMLAACFMAKLNAFLERDGSGLRCVEVAVEETPTNTVTFAGDPADVLPERPAAGNRHRLVVARGRQHQRSRPRRRGTMSTIRISEIFGPTVQGEGALIGKPTVFVRTGGCDFRCSWCDTLHAVLPAHRHDWSPMTPEEILARVETADRRRSGAHHALGRQSGDPAARAPDRVGQGAPPPLRDGDPGQRRRRLLCRARLAGAVAQAALLRHDDRLGRVRRLPRRRRRRTAHRPQGRRVRRCRLRLRRPGGGALSVAAAISFGRQPRARR